jgi:hypothetical protein
MPSSGQSPADAKAAKAAKILFWVVRARADRRQTKYKKTGTISIGREASHTSPRFSVAP